MRPRLPRRDGGAVMTEFMIVIIPMLVLVLGLMQVAQAFTASLLVRHAAMAAARSAAVVLAEGDTPEGQRPNDEPPPPDGTHPYRFGTGEGGLDYLEDARFAAVLDAAAYAVTPVASPVDVATREELEAAVARITGGPSPRSASAALESTAEAAGGGILARAAAKYAYAIEATAVVFPDETDPSGYRSAFADGDLVRVRVTFLFRCSMPLVSALVCRAWNDLPQQARGDLLAMPAGPLGMFRGPTPGRYLALTAGSALPLQGRADAQLDPPEEDPDES